MILWEHSRPSTDVHGVGMRDGLLLKDWNGTETKETPTCALDHFLYRYLGKAVWWVPRKDITEHIQRGKNCIKLKCIPSQQDFYLLFLEIKTGTREERSSFLGLDGARGNVWLTLTLLMLPKVSVHQRGYGAQFLTHSQPRPGVCLLRRSEQGCRCEGLNLSPL